MKKRHCLLAALLLITLSFGFIVGAWMPRDDDFFALRKNFQIFGEIYEVLVGEYVDPLSPERLMRSGIEAMLADLDPYTTFMDEAENADISIITRGRYGGVGLNVGLRGGRITVLAPVEGTSAYKQGVQTGDIVTHIDAQPTSELSLEDARSLMRGEPGTTIKITVEREGAQEPLHFVLTREEVDLKSVPYRGFIGGDTLRGLGYIKLDRFAHTAGVEVRQALSELQKTGKLNGLVLDLRDNPGGLLEAAVSISELFVPQGSVIVSMRGRQPQNERIYRSKQPPLAPDLPLAVLVNEYSASASEIVAGAVQDLDRGVVVGDTTFGKGLVQVVKELPYNTALKVTIAKYYTPSGRCIQALDYGRHDGTYTSIPDSLRRTFYTAAGRPVRDSHGITPDMTIAPPMPSSLEKALKRRAAFFFYANHYAAQHEVPPANYEVSEAILKDFEAWLEGEGFSYRSDVDLMLERLDRELAVAGYESLDGHVEALASAVRQAKANDLERHAESLKAQLRSEILARYLTESEQVAAALNRDPQVQEAVRLLETKDQYRKILSTP